MSNLWRMLALAWLGGIGSPNLTEGLVERRPAPWIEAAGEARADNASVAYAHGAGKPSGMPVALPPRS